MNKFIKIIYLGMSGAIVPVLVAVMLTGLAATAGAASRPVAIVEESPKADGKAQAFNLLAESDTFDLAAGETVILGYLKSCMRETITGGSVTIGSKESTVVGGTVTREQTQCAVNKLALTADESQQSATIAFRGQVKHIFTRQPLIMAGKSQGVTIEPVEGGEVWQIVPENGRIDFRAAKLQMQPGANYRVKGATQVVIVEVDDAADTTKTGLLERVVILD